MTGYCTIHEIDMQERESKTKFDESGSPKTYFGHMADGKMCFGAPMKNYSDKKVVMHPAALPKPKIEEKVDWDAKDKQSMAQTAMKSASEIVAAMINSGLFVTTDEDPEAAVKTMANNFYKEIISMKSS